MLVSMTGFSSTTLNLTHGGHPITITILLKSLNARYFEVTCKLPHSLTHLETEIIKRLKKILIRGTIYVTIQLTGSSATAKNAVVISFDLVDNYFKALQQIKERCKIESPIQINDLIHLPHILEFPEELWDMESSKTILESIETLAQNLMEDRTREGKSLYADIEKRIKEIQILLKDLQSRASSMADKRKEQLKALLHDVLPDIAKESQEAHVQNLTMQIERYDVSEELVRFATHLKNLLNTISAAGIEKGKKLDFIIQELFREINTVAAKANDSEMSNAAINIKVELEKIREQTQNII